VKIFFPTIKKFSWTIAGTAILFSTLFLRLLPPSIDILDLRELPQYLVIVFGRIPISFFDWITSNRYTPSGEGFLVFPSLQQVSFAVFIDIIFIYVVTCLILHWKKRHDDTI
jgi:hypothetical protein